MKTLKYFFVVVFSGFLFSGCSTSSLKNAFYNSQADYYYVDKDYRSAYEKYRSAAESGDGYAYYRLYEMYRYGKGVKKDNEMADLMLQKAVSLGDDTAMVVMANRLLSNKKNVKKAIKLLKLAAQKENKYAYSDLSLIYRYGYGVKRNLSLANEYARLAKASGLRVKTKMSSKVKQGRKKVSSRYLLTKEIQAGLKKLGFYNGKIDGIYGPMTKKAIRMFQKFYGYKTNTVISVGLLNQIKSKI